MTTRNRWIAMAATAAALTLLTIPLWHDDNLVSDEVQAAADTACDAKAKPAPLNYTMKDVNNVDVKLSSFKGKVILLNYWATWCGPCKVEIPEFVKLYDEYKDRGFVVLGVSTDDDAETLRAYAADMKMSYPVLVGRDNEAFLDSFGPLWGLPTSYFIGRDGAVCGKQIGPATKEDFEKAIKALL